MKRIFLTAALWLLALPAMAAGDWGSNTTINSGQCRTFTFTGSDAGNAQPAVTVNAGELSFTATATNGTAVSVTFWYVDAASDNPASVGTLAATVTGTGRFPAYVATNGGVLDVDIDTDGDGGSIKVCSAAYANVGRSGVSGYLAAAEDAAFDVVANGTTGITRFETGEVRSYTNSCLQLQEAINPYLDTSVTTYENYSVKFAGDFNIVWSDLYDQGPYRSCLAIFPTASVIGTDGTGGFSTADATRQGWPEIQTRVVATGMGARSATAGAATTLTDGDGSDLSGQVGNYVRITGDTGVGQTRYISSATATELTVDLAWAVNPDATSDYEVFTIPFRAGGGTGYAIHWDDARLFVVQTGQDDRGVVIQRGNAWACGETNNTTEGVACSFSNATETGKYDIQISGTDAASTGWVDGRIAEIDTTNLVSADRALITEMNFGHQRNIHSARVTASGGGTRSQDNIWLWSALTWGSHRLGGSNVSLFGNAATVWSNNHARWVGQYVANNHVGFSLGTGTAGGEMQHLTTCTSGYCSNTVLDGGAFVTLEHPIIESNDYGQIVAFDTLAEMQIDGMHLENGTVSGHQIIVAGAGMCSAADAATVGRPCAEDGNCGGGTCQTNGGTSQSNNITFRGGSLGSMSQAAASPNWRQAILGENATENNGQVRFSGAVQLPVTVVPVNSTGTLPCTAAGAPYWYCTAANTNPTLNVGVALPSVTTGIDAAVFYGDVTNQTSNTLLWPYRFQSADNEIALGPFTNQVNLAANDALQLGGVQAALVTPTANNVQLWAWPHHVENNAGNPNLYLNKMICIPGSYVDATDTEVHTWRPVIGDATSIVSSTQFGTITFTEGTDAAGTPKATFAGANTTLFNCNSGTCVTKNSAGIGILLSSETDTDADNTSAVSCMMTAIPSFGNDY